MVNWKKIFGNEIIEFYCHPDLEGVIPEPRPARKDLPDWFKNLSPSIDESRDSFGGKSMTAKKCLPLLDAMSLGFTIPLCGDLGIKSNRNNSKIEVINPPQLKLCEFHSAEQVGGPDAICENHGNPIKFINHWVIKTAPGWSTLFISPINHFNRTFTCLSGLVDTDTYPKEINFPAALHATDFDDVIPSGTPLVTAIPIKRNAYSHKPKIRKMTTKEFKSINTMNRIQNVRRHYYTHELRVKK